MQLFSCLRKRMTGRRQDQRFLACKPALRFRPQLETLEARDVPSTLTVTNNLDNNSIGSLRYEIGAAKSGDTIVFAPSLSGQAIRLTGVGLDGNTELLLNKNLDIEGPGANQLTIAGAGSRVFEVAANVDATLSGLTIANGSGTLGGFDPDQRGYDGLGGGILNFGTLKVNGFTLVNDSASGEGGGIYNSFGTVSIVNSTLFGNSAGYGGGVYNNHGTVTIGNSTLSANTATYDGGGVCNSFGTLTVSNSTLSGNKAGTYGGGLYNADGSATLVNSTLSGNSASQGGGIYNICTSLDFHGTKFG